MQRQDERVLTLDFSNRSAGLGLRRGLRLVSRGLPSSEKYRLLDLKRRRAQIRARRALDLV